MKKADFIVIAAAALVIGVLLFALYGTGSHNGAYARVEVDGEVTQVLPLNKDAELLIETENGGKNTLVISGGKASVIDANCPDKICARHSPVFRNGETIICLPHKVVITIIDESSADDVDAVAKVTL